VGTCLHKLERYEEARRQLEQALEFFPDDGRVHYQLALTCDALGLPQEARRHYGRARALNAAGRTT
jgi:Flp pilus assembly protein TadD